MQCIAVLRPNRKLLYDHLVQQRVSERAAASLTLGRFELLCDLGAGGMAEVWRARDTSSGADVALKRLRRDPDPSRDASRLALFEREYHMLAQLDHPHIVRVQDYGVEGGVAYYTMELLEGSDLRDRGIVPWRELCAVVRDLASALALIHSRRLVHRDLGPRNVRFGADGHAKLIDFGALAPMGMCREVIGTPPFVSPELLNGMAIDGRSDLYALGGLMYVALSGRHAYPARSLHELRDRFRTRPVDITALVPDVPAALGALVMSLLSLDESARPRSASEVIERVSAVADLPRSDDVDFGRTFLSTPKLVGRDDAIATIRRHVIQGRSRRGTTLVIEGEPGVGRTRLLEHCALEAKLAGAFALQAFASDAARGDYGVLQALAHDLCVATPELALSCAAPHAEWLAHALPEVAARLGRTPTASALEAASLRQRVQQAALDWLLKVSRRKHLVLLIDDLDRCDESSASVLAALSRQARSLPLTLIASVPLGAEVTSTPAVQLIATHAARIKLRPLSVADFTVVVRSLFGDVPGMSALAQHLHGLCGGVMSACMAFAEHLVDTDLVRYERGTWVLPASLDGLALPEGVRTPHERRLNELDSDARELCDALALSARALPLAVYAHLTSHGNAARLHAGIAQLLSAAVITSSSEGYAFAHPGLAPVIRARMHEDAAERAHARLFRAHAAISAEPMQLAYHALYGGEPATAARLVIDFWKERLDSEHATELEWPAYMRETIEPLVAYCERERFSPLDVYVLRQVLVIATMWSDPGYGLEQGRALDPILRRDVGLVYWDEVTGDTPLERLGRCFERAQAAYDASPPNERGLPPLIALQRLGRHVLYGTQCASFSNDNQRLQELAELIEKVASVAPSLEVIDLLVRAALWSIRGLSDQGATMLEAVLARLEDGRAGMPDSHQRLFRLGVLYGLGLVRAKYLDPRVPSWADELETHLLHQPNAWRLRKLYYLHEPNMKMADACQERMEMLALQLNRGFWGNTAFLEVWISAAYADFQGLKQSLAVLDNLAERFSSQAPSRDFARALHHLLSGDCARAEALFADVHAACSRLEDYFRASLAQDYRALALVSLGRAQEARATQLEMLARMPEDWLYRYRSEVVLALAEAELGLGDAARARVVRAVDELRAREMFGPHCAMTLECAARVAMRLGDRGLFERYAGELAALFEDGRCPTLRARHAALVKEAQRLELLDADSSLLASIDPLKVETRVDHTESVREAFDLCTGPAERSACALQLIAQSAQVGAGFLYRVDSAREIELIACSAGCVPPSEIAEVVRARLAALELSSDPETEELDVTPTEQQTGLITDHTGVHYQLVFLSSGPQSQLPNAVAALQLGSEQPRIIAYDLLVAIAQALFEAGDLTAVA